jgi:hypothetical protein
MRTALFATAVMNLVVAAAFLSPAAAFRSLLGLPEAEHLFYRTTVGLFVALFGLGYLWSAVVGRGERLFLGLAAVGKLSFFTLLVGCWASGALPFRAPLAGTADLVFGALFLRWLVWG